MAGYVLAAAFGMEGVWTILLAVRLVQLQAEVEQLVRQMDALDDLSDRYAALRGRSAP